MTLYEFLYYSAIMEDVMEFEKWLDKQECSKEAVLNDAHLRAIWKKFWELETTGISVVKGKKKA